MRTSRTTRRIETNAYMTHSIVIFNNNITGLSGCWSNLCATAILQNCFHLIYTIAIDRRNS